MTETRAFTVEPITGHIGARITDVDLTQPVDQAAVHDLNTLLSEHLVLIFPDQHLNRDQQKRVTTAFGPLMRLPYIEPMSDDQEVIAVLKEATDQSGGVFGGEWHADMSFLDAPPAGSLLSALEVPPYGGDTLWANQIIAYEALSSDLKKIVDGRNAMHAGKPYGAKHAPSKETRSSASIKMVRGDPEADAERPRPAVRVDPETGRKALNVNPTYTTRLDGMTEAESAPILAALYKHATRPDFCCRHRWIAGDLVVWDNRWTMHYATNDYDGHRRLLHRTTFGG